LIVSEGYKSLHIPYNPKLLATSLKLGKKNDILKNAARLGYRPVLCHYEAKDFIRDYMHKLGIKIEHEDEILDIVNKVVTNIPTLHEKKPFAVAAGVIAEYAVIYGYEINLEEFSKSILVSMNIIKTMKTVVARVMASS
jgi:transcription initiation factor TFIIIB Brf1 subunit/transcription initiation factor TFIIB